MNLAHRSYLIAATPRSGRTLLCELLAGTGVAGRPAEHFEDLQATGRPRQPREKLDRVRDPAVLELLAPTEPGAPVTPDAFRRRCESALREGMTPNGGFATKVMWSCLAELPHGLQAVPQCAGVRGAAALAAAFPGLRH